MNVKPLGKKSYGSIGHLPGSRMGPADHHVNEGQARCMTVELPKGDRLIVQEKLDGSNVGVCKVGGRIIPIIRAGWAAADSRREMHHMFNRWAMQRAFLFDAILGDGERLCGEWLAQAHGTKYDLPHEPFVAFDLFDADDNRLTYDDFFRRVDGPFVTPHVFFAGESAFPLSEAAKLNSHHGALEPMEGVVYRWERHAKGQPPRVLQLAKWVRPDKEDGCYLGDDKPPIWNWREA